MVNATPQSLTNSVLAWVCDLLSRALDADVHSKTLGYSEYARLLVACHETLIQQMKCQVSAPGNDCGGPVLHPDMAGRAMAGSSDRDGQ